MVLSWILALSILTGQLVKVPLESGGITLIDIVVIILCLGGLLQTRLKFKKLLLFVISALFFILIALLSLIFTPLHLTIPGYMMSLFYTIRFAGYFLLGWLILSKAFPNLKENLRQILSLSGIGLAVLGLLQFILLPDLTFLTKWGWDPHFFRTVSTFLDPNFAGAYFVLTLIILSASQRDKEKTDLLRLFFVVTYIALLTTFSRSSYLMFLVSGLTLSFLKKSKNMAISVTFLFIVLMAAFLLYGKIIAQPRNINRTQSASSRVNTWQQGFEVFKHSKILGVGFNSYRYAIKEYHLGDPKFLKSHGSSSNDSSLLFVLATTGILGFAAYCVFLFSLIKKSWGKNLFLISGLSGLIVHSFFSNSLFYPPILFWIILMAV